MFVGAAKAASVASSPTGRSARLASKKSLEPHGTCLAKFGVWIEYVWDGIENVEEGARVSNRVGAELTGMCMCVF